MVKRILPEALTSPFLSYALDTWYHKTSCPDGPNIILETAKGPFPGSLYLRGVYAVGVSTTKFEGCVECD